MKKLRLNLDELEIESFATTAEADALEEGTVHGYHCTCNCCTDNDPTCYNTCAGNATCHRTCVGNNTCGQTACYGTCYNTCNWGSCDGWETGDGNCC